MDKTANIFVAGHKGMVGSAICRALREKGYENILKRSHTELDLTRQNQVESFFKTERPEYVYLSAARVGGILANSTYPADFIYQNLAIQNNVIHCAHQFGVTKLLFLGSSCIYPRNCQQPMKEEYLLTDTLETTNEAYAVAKIAGIKMCQNYFNQFGSNFISVMPTNLYGPHDNFDLESSHVLPAMIRKFHDAKIKWDAVAKPGNKQIAVDIWGTGKPKREFLHVDDLAKACLFAMNRIDAKELYGMGISHLNVGTGLEISISELAETIRNIVGFQGGIRFDTSKPDGSPRKLLDVSRIRKLGWRHDIRLTEGLVMTYDWYLKNMVTANTKTPPPTENKS